VTDNLLARGRQENYGKEGERQIKEDDRQIIGKRVTDTLLDM
jgi:hypothetical protein